MNKHREFLERLDKEIESLNRMKAHAIEKGNYGLEDSTKSELEAVEMITRWFEQTFESEIDS